MKIFRNLMPLIVAATLLLQPMAVCAVQPGQTQTSDQNIVVVIDPGHGGTNLGGQIPGLDEKNMTLVTALAMKEELEKYGKTVLVYHFADALKSLCESSYNWVKGDKGPIGRTILQNVGTAYRKNNPECWVNIARQIALGCSEEYMLIPDCRYKNEALGFLDFDYKNVRIERPDFDNGLTEEQKKHISETAMSTFSEYDYIITNDGSLDDLREKVKQAFQLEVE